ncbi:hypothetical protein DYI24_12810 [Rhodopseudomonas sp. BR0C11]|uniref:hypothetical protein n=1 Tax=Rhodopseudomonas sp. BR0C11 TaxID=2269370 RepID=UPI0013DFB2C6|nr:hypothetical protein [Rhodopseudomonas sp. BR0C11]NEV77918.1 hypothetical protein [Rhodopseudomonas sp. BR0C11]
MNIYPDKMTPELREVLGKICFQLAPIAQAFRAAGHEIEEKAEAEQAFVLHWLIKLALKHGSNWRDEASDQILQMKTATSGLHFPQEPPHQ